MRFAASLTVAAVLLAASHACSSEVEIISDNADGGSGASSANGGAGGATSTSSGTGGVGGSTPQCPNTTLTGECSLAYQDCPSGEECTIEGVAVNARTVCADDVQGLDRERGRYCAQDSDCQRGMLCIADRCTQFCCENDFDTCLGGDCNVNIDFGGGNVAVACTGGNPCDVFEPGSCGPDDCHIHPSGQTTCTPPSSNLSPEGGPCSLLDDCDDGQGCFIDTCRYYCELGSAQPVGNGGCPSGQTCAITMMLPSGLGFCQP